MRKKANNHLGPNSIGRILMTYGLTEDQLGRAVRFKQDHGDILLGEACVRLEFISRETLEVAVAKQEAARKKNGAGALVELATRRTRTISASISTLAAASMALAEKIK